jgi:amyloid beta precursor protein binding protein 1
MATTDKYDRQLRLWGANGQRCLGETTVILLQATAVGCEVLKNLVLPGVGAFRVVDSAQVSREDASSNFFAPSSSSGGLHPQQPSRAQVVVEYLQELNDDVKGDFVHVPDLLGIDYDDLLADAAISGTRNVLVVASDLEPPVMDRVSRACDRLRLSLIVVQSYGLLGTVRLQTTLLPLLDPKPRDTVPDLRLASPFPALRQLADSIDLSSLENHQHGHIPYPILLLKAMEEWRGTAKERGGTVRLLPATFAEKQEFQATIRAMARNFDAELNFQEAVQNAYLAYTSRELDLEHLTRLRDATAAAAGASNGGASGGGGSSSSSNVAPSSVVSFHVMLQGLDKFYAKNGRAPLQGTIPDMTASTDLYVQLQRLYLQQARDDWNEILALTNASVASDEDLTRFCQNVFDLDLLHTRALHQVWSEAVAPDDVCEDLAMATMEGDEREDQIPLLWGLGLDACRLFFLRNGRYPGVLQNWEPDVTELQAFIVDVVHKYKLQDNDLIRSTLLRNTDYASELARYGNAEIHNIASLIGGVASQEAVKIITGQYVPLDNTYIYNGIASTGGVYRF